MQFVDFKTDYSLKLNVPSGYVDDTVQSTAATVDSLVMHLTSIH